MASIWPLNSTQSAASYCEHMLSFHGCIQSWRQCLAGSSVLWRALLGMSQATRMAANPLGLWINDPLTARALHPLQVAGVLSSDLCQYVVEYKDGSESAGSLAWDSVGVPPSLGTFSAKGVALGCSLKSDVGSSGASLAFPGQNASSLDGILGLGRGPLSLMAQLTAKKALPSPAFSICLEGSSGGGGHLVLGRQFFKWKDAILVPLANTTEL